LPLSTLIAPLLLVGKNCRDVQAGAAGRRSYAAAVDDGVAFAADWMPKPLPENDVPVFTILVSEPAKMRRCCCPSRSHRC